MPTSGSGTGTPITPIPPAGVGGGGTGTAVIIGCATGTTAVTDQCLCRHCQTDTPYTSLEAYRKAMTCIEPWQFWGWDNAGLRTYRGKACQELVLERSIRGTVGRLDVLDAILRAEGEFLNNLNYAVVPTWFSEQLQLNKMLKTRYSYVTKVGAPVRTVLGTAQREAQAVTYLNYTADAGDVITFSASQASAKWPDTFTLTIARPADLTDASEVALYFFTDDRYEQKSNHARWRIEPIDVTLTSAAITITGRSWMLAKPQLYNTFQPHPKPISAFGDDWGLDPSYMPNYVERLEVARLTVNQCDAGLVRTESTCTCSGCTCEFDSDGVPTHCHTCTEIDLCIENARFGLIRPLYPHLNLWNLGSLPCPENDPKSVCIHYQAGDCSRDWTQDIAILATTYLHGICECSFPCLSRWWDDRASGENKQNTFEALNNPFGTLTGHLATWRTIERFKLANVSSW